MTVIPAIISSIIFFGSLYSDLFRKNSTEPSQPSRERH